MSIKFRVLDMGGYFGFWGRPSADFNFYGREDFSDKRGWQEKRININEFAGLFRDWVGIFVNVFFSGSFLMLCA